MVYAYFQQEHNHNGSSKIYALHKFMLYTIYIALYQIKYIISLIYCYIQRRTEARLNFGGKAIDGTDF